MSLQVAESVEVLFVICCHPRAEFEWALGETSWMRWGDAMSSGFPDSTSGVCSSLLFTVGEFKRRRSGMCWLLSGEPSFSKRAGSPGNWSKILFQAQSIRTVLGWCLVALWRRWVSSPVCHLSGCKLYLFCAFVKNNQLFHSLKC